MRTKGPAGRGVGYGGIRWWVSLLALIPLGMAWAEGFTCFICGSRIVNTMVHMTDAVTDERREVCEVCVRLPDVCYMCALPIKVGVTRLEDGRVYCARDAREAVLDRGAALRLCQENFDTLNRLLFRHMELPWTNVDLAITDWTEMRQILQTPGFDRVCPLTLGYTRSQRLRDGGWQHKVRILGGRCRGEILAVLAHELAHGWVAENIDPRRKIGADATEGFCELVAHQFMEHLGERREVGRIARNSYSRGQIALFVAAEKEYGLYTVLQWMRHGVDLELSPEEPDRIRRIDEPVTPPSTNIYRPPLPLAPPAVPNELVLSGISGVGSRRLALINGSALAAGETARIRVGSTNVAVRCLSIETGVVRIRVEGEPAERELRLKGGSASGP